MATLNGSKDNTRALPKRLLSTAARIDGWLVLILFLSLLVRLYGIDNPLVDFSSWRQVDTTSIARNFAQSNFNVFHPQLDYDGPGPNYVQLELQITTFFIAILFKLIGMRELYARIIPVLFFLGSIVFLYLFTKHYLERKTALLAALVYSILPMGVYYSRAVQPESAMLLFGVAGLYTFAVWTKKQNAIWFAIAFIVGVLSALAKLPNLFLLLPITVIAYSEFGIKALTDKRVWGYIAGVIAIAALFFWYGGWFSAGFGSPYDYHDYTGTSGATSSFVSNIASKHVLPQLLSAFASPQGLQYFGQYLIPLVLTPIGAILLIVGLVPWGIRRDDSRRYLPLYAWMLAAVLFCLTIAAIIRIDYYLIPLLPIASIFIARTLVGLSAKTWALPIVTVLLLVMGIQSYYAVAPLYDLDKQTYRFGNDLRLTLRPDEPVILGAFNPAMLYYSGHKGWRSDDLALDEFKFLKAEGAGYYIPLNSIKSDELRDYLNKNHKLRSTKSGCYYYDLKEGNR